MPFGERGKLRQTPRIVAVIEAGRAEAHMAGEGLGESGEGLPQGWRLACPLPNGERVAFGLGRRPGEGARFRSSKLPLSRPSHKCEGHPPPGGGRAGACAFEIRLRARQDRELQPIAPFQKISEVEEALPLLAAEVANGKQAAEASVSGTVGGPSGNVRRAVPEDEPAADGIANPGGLGREVPSNRAGQGIAIGDRKAGEAERGGRRGKLLGMRSAAQKREIRSGEQLDVGRPAGHAGRRLLASSPSKDFRGGGPV